MDIGFRVSKLEKEQQQRRDISKRKAEAERAKQEKFLEKKKELEELALRISAEREALDEKRRLEEEEEIERTGGVAFKMVLHPILMNSNDDRVILPESALIELTNKNAFIHGPLLFQITSGNSSIITHCGVREFSAAEGTIGLPQKIADTFKITEESVTLLGKMTIKYMRLPKITYAKLQPVEAAFSSVSNVKSCLTENLRHYSTLTEGDELSVWFRGARYLMRVQELRPAGGGSLLDTDVEVDLDVSEETTQKAIGSSSRIPSVSSSIEKMDTGEVDTEEMIELPPEPIATDGDVIECRVRTLQGTTRTRRFSRLSPINNLFQYAWSESGGRAAIPQMRALQVATRFPSKVYTFADAEAGKTFSDLGLNNAQELFLVSVSK